MFPLYPVENVFLSLFFFKNLTLNLNASVTDDGRQTDGQTKTMPKTLSEIMCEVLLFVTVKFGIIPVILTDCTR